MDVRKGHVAGRLAANEREGKQRVLLVLEYCGQDHMADKALQASALKPRWRTPSSGIGERLPMRPTV